MSTHSCSPAVTAETQKKGKIAGLPSLQLLSSALIMNTALRACSSDVCIHVCKKCTVLCDPFLYTHIDRHTHTQYKSILIHLDEVLLFSNISGVVPVTWSTQALLCSPLIPPIILLEGQRPINRGEMFQRDACKVCGCLGEQIFVQYMIVCFCVRVLMLLLVGTDFLNQTQLFLNHKKNYFFSTSKLQKAPIRIEPSSDEMFPKCITFCQDKLMQKVKITHSSEVKKCSDS